MNQSNLEIHKLNVLLEIFVFFDFLGFTISHFYLEDHPMKFGHLEGVPQPDFYGDNNDHHSY